MGTGPGTAGRALREAVSSPQRRRGASGWPSPSSGSSPLPHPGTPPCPAALGVSELFQNPETPRPGDVSRSGPCPWTAGSRCPAPDPRGGDPALRGPGRMAPRKAGQPRSPQTPGAPRRGAAGFWGALRSFEDLCLFPSEASGRQATIRAQEGALSQPPARGRPVPTVAVAVAAGTGAQRPGLGRGGL